MTVDEAGIFADVVAGTDGLIYTFILWIVFMIFVLMGTLDLDIISSVILPPIVVIGVAILISVLVIGVTSLLPILAGFFVLIFLFVYIPLSL